VGRTPVFDVFENQNQSQNSPSGSKQAEEIKYLKNENRRLQEDFDEAINVLHRISMERANDKLRQRSTEKLLEELKKEKEENIRLRIKVNTLLSQISDVAYLCDDDDEEKDEEKE
jgi:hypothetical protein